ncbi:hypothetical protein SAMN04490207_0890 [Pseudomonas gessardii]|jgi:hypothetical protein|nr:hypothetical protein [Pseudomonas gessardii]ONH49284.1 hypothetical protein BLL38_01035 [Pseudomonas gessardii]SDQ54872.1 hypothetical protein SAMN04490207_0890 [Pseudomonas gessardii]
MKPRYLAQPMFMTAALLCCQAALAHAPVFDCYIEHDDWVKCEAGYTDGSSAEGRKIQVQDASNKLLLDARVDQDNSYRFQAPTGSYRVVFLGGDGHDTTIQSSDISR